MLDRVSSWKHDFSNKERSIVVENERVITQIQSILTNKSLEEFIRFPADIIDVLAREKIPEHILMRYSLSIIDVESYHWIYDPNEEVEIHLWWETNMVLNYEERRVANLWISEEKWNIIFNEIQCAKDDGKHWQNFRTATFNWKKALVLLWEEYIKRIFQVKHSFILPSKRDKWSTIWTSSQAWWRGYKIYDQTALELWYTYNPETELYEKDI